jgi:hypothetical protein
MTGRPTSDRVQGEAEAKVRNRHLLDLGSLASLACSSEDHEAYSVVAASENFRVGLVVSASSETSVSFRIEVLLQFLAKDTQPKVVDLEGMNKILDALVERGYSLNHHDSCWVSCEREVTADDIEAECLVVVEIIQSQNDEKKRRTDEGTRGV